MLWRGRRVELLKVLDFRGGHSEGVGGRRFFDADVGNAGHKKAQADKLALAVEVRSTHAPQAYRGVHQIAKSNRRIVMEPRDDDSRARIHAEKECFPAPTRRDAGRLNHATDLNPLAVFLAAYQLRVSGFVRRRQGGTPEGLNPIGENDRRKTSFAALAREQNIIAGLNVGGVGAIDRDAHARFFKKEGVSPTGECGHDTLNANRMTASSLLRTHLAQIADVLDGFERSARIRPGTGGDEEGHDRRRPESAAECAVHYSLSLSERQRQH